MKFVFVQRFEQEHQDDVLYSSEHSQLELGRNNWEEFEICMFKRFLKFVNSIKEGGTKL